MVKTAGFKGMIVKIVVVLALALVAAVLFFMNKNLVRENKKMIKYIKNEGAFKQDLNNLKESEDIFSQYIVRVEKGNNADRERIKSDYINQLLQLIDTNGLKVDSYRSGIEEKDGFVIFRYNVTIVGEFVRAIVFFSRLREQAKYIYVDKYAAELHRETLIRMALTVEIVGVEGKKTKTDESN